MTRDEITCMARLAGFGVLLPSSVDGRGEIYDGDGTITDEMERFAALVAAHVRKTEFKPDWTNYWQGRIDGAADEREACARIAEEQPTFTRYAQEVLEDVVKLIRARGDA